MLPCDKRAEFEEMSEQEGARSRRPRRASWVAMFLGLALMTTSMTACEERSALDEAIEEVKDEASDAKKAIEDEIDDHT